MNDTPRPFMDAEIGALLVAALRSDEYEQGWGDPDRGVIGHLAVGCVTDPDGAERPERWEVTGVLCDLAVKKGVILPPTKVTAGNEVIWLYRPTGEDSAPSCITIPETVLTWAGLRLCLGDPLVINGEYRTWAGHADQRVPFKVFADVLEASLTAPKADTEEATAAA